MARAPTSLSKLDRERESALRELDPLTVTKLWDNPCWLSFRLNFIAFRFNDPVYRWIETRYGLVRPEFVALYAVGLKGGVAAKNIVSSSGLPKNTLSRAIQKLLQRRLLSVVVGGDAGKHRRVRATRADRRELLTRMLDRLGHLLVGIFLDVSD